jgi:hypothetical protein
VINAESEMLLTLCAKYSVITKKNTLTGKKEGRGKNYGRFLKMIDDLQTPKHKTNHKYRSYFPLLSFIIEIKPTIKSKQI